MDIWFSLFVSVVALAAAVGASLVLVGYINILPATFAVGRRWVMAVAVVPTVIVAAPAAVVFMLQPFVELIPVATLVRWLGVPAALIHLGVLGRFLQLYWQDNAKGGKQLLGGTALVLLAVGLLYGLGPTFAERIMAGVK